MAVRKILFLSLWVLVAAFALFLAIHFSGHALHLFENLVALFRVYVPRG